MLEHFVKLSPAEVVQFKKFVASPYFNTNRKVVLLANYLSVRYPDLDDKVLNKKVIYRFVFRNQKYNDANFRKLNSEFNSVFKRFLTELEIEGSSQLRKYLLLMRYHKLKIPEKFKQIHEEIIKADLNIFSKDLYYYINLFISEYSYYLHAIYDNVKEKQKSFETLSEFADLLIIYLKLNLFMQEDDLLLDKTKVLNDNYSFKKEIFYLVEKNIDLIKKRHPDIFFVYCNFRIKNDDKYFYELEKYCIENKNILKGSLEEGYIKSYYNFYERKFHEIKSKEEASIKLFKFLDHYFVSNKPKTEALVDGYIPPGLFIKSVNISLYLNKFLWAEKFIEKNKIYLSELNREEVYCITKAFVQFHKKDYKSALEYLSGITGKYIQLESNMRIYRLTIYYELRESEGIKSELINLRTFKNNKKTSREIVIILNNFLKYFNMLLKIRNTEKKQRREEIIMFKDKLIKDNSFIMRRQWFMEKIEELSL